MAITEVLKNGATDKILFEGGYAQATGTGSTSNVFAFNYYTSMPEYDSILGVMTKK